MSNNPQYLIIHTAAYEGNIEWSDIDQWHRDRGWREGGYHYFINYDGSIEKGRDEDEVGAHCVDMNMNTKSIGICMEGHGDKEVWTNEQWESLEALARKEMDEYDIPIENVLGHRETGAPKTCPGRKIDMDDVRLLLEMPQFLDPVAILPPVVLDQHQIFT